MTHMLQKQNPIPCPASFLAGADSAMCQSTELYSATQLEEHLVDIHSIHLAQVLLKAGISLNVFVCAGRKSKSSVHE